MRTELDDLRAQVEAAEEVAQRHMDRFEQAEHLRKLAFEDQQNLRARAEKAETLALQWEADEQITRKILEERIIELEIALVRTGALNDDDDDEDDLGRRMRELTKQGPDADPAEVVKVTTECAGFMLYQAMLRIPEAKNYITVSFLIGERILQVEAKWADGELTPADTITRLETELADAVNWGRAVWEFVKLQPSQSGPFALIPPPWDPDQEGGS